MKKSILKQMADAGTRAGEGAEIEANPLASRRQSQVISNVSRALTQLNEDSLLTLDVNKIERSPFKDRFDNDSEANEELEALKLSIASEGQKIAVLVRPHPAKPGQYQLAYGYRRWAAIKALNDDNREPIKIKAYVRELTDRQLIEEQSLENGVRESLTWIEQAVWSLQLKNIGLSQRAICPILGLTEAGISHFFKVTSAIPEDIIYAIGRAKSVGRPKWTLLAELMRGDDKIDMARRLINTADFVAADSPSRFSQVFDILKEHPNSKRLKSFSLAKSWISQDQSVTFTMDHKAQKVAIELRNTNAAPFGDWLSDNLDALYKQFQKNKIETGD